MGKVKPNVTTESKQNGASNGRPVSAFAVYRNQKNLSNGNEGVDDDKTQTSISLVKRMRASMKVKKSKNRKLKMQGAKKLISAHTQSTYISSENFMKNPLVNFVESKPAISAKPLKDLDNFDITTNGECEKQQNNVACKTNTEVKQNCTNEQQEAIHNLKSELSTEIGKDSNRPQINTDDFKSSEIDETSSIKDRLADDEDATTEDKLDRPSDDTAMRTKREMKRKISVTKMSQKNCKVPKMPSPKGANCVEDGKLLLQWLIHPYKLENFLKSIWEKKPLLVRRNIGDYASGIFSSKELNMILTEQNVQYGVNLDITSYQDGKRETHNTEGRAYAPVVWDYYGNGCSIRLRNPQSFSKSVHQLCVTMQEFFKSMVGANVYLTPAGTQGFAPHYDDIEAFVLQLEGKKEWKVYKPRTDAETLPRFSSENFTESEIGEKVMKITLEAGDLLYFPRGFIHQAKSLPDTHSLHITISTYQRNTWHDIMQSMLGTALSKATAEDIEFRRGIPLDCFDHLGVQNSDHVSPRRDVLLKKFTELFQRLSKYADVDAAVDEHAVSFLHDSLPPILTDKEKLRSIHGAKVAMTEPGQPENIFSDINVKTKVRMLRKNAIRLCVPDDDASVRVYHSIQNPSVYHKEERKYFEIVPELAPVVEHLIQKYPAYIAVDELPMETDSDKVELAASLYEKGILMTEGVVEMTS